ncbi:signal peptidase I SipW [Virgibacillus halophilus]|uniref:Signal peptidase I n=2 Tax=Tigheibacillus halophilus TaxID=361280 RepID=A0ABU5C322_9BACI|nr:signal peptidase I [Virgibacillus halophilus]
MKKRKAVRWINNTVSLFLAALLILVASIVIISKASGGEPQAFGYQIKTVLSGSMEPDIKTGSIIAVKPGGDMTRFKKNDVITFTSDENILITHRIVKVMPSGNNVRYQTKGDNNDGPDMNPVMSQNVVAEYTGFTVPYVGYALHFLQSKNGAWLMLIPGFLLMIYSGVTVWRALSEVEKEAPNKGTENAG